MPLVEEITIQLRACWINHTSEKYKMIVIDLSEQQKQDNGPRTCCEYKKSTWNCESIVSTFLFGVNKND